MAHEPLTVEAQLSLISGMFDRLERQATELGKLQAQADALHAELESERRAHRAAAQELGQARAEAEALRVQAAELEQEREARRRLDTELADERSSNSRLESHLSAAWYEVQALRAELDRPRWRRRRKHRPASRAWAHRFEASPHRS